MKKGMMTTIEINETHIKVLQAKMQQETPYLSRCQMKRLSQSTSESTLDHIVAELGGMISARDIDPHHLLVVVPRRYLIVKQMTFPSVNEAEIRKMIELQIIRQVPYTREDIIFDHYVLERQDSGDTRVLLIIVHKDVINRYLNILNRAGLHPQRFVASSFGIVQWFITQEKGKQPKPAKPVMLMDLDYSHCEVCFCHQHRLLFSRSIPLGIRDLTREQREFIDQIDLTLEAYQYEQMGDEIQEMMIIANFPGVQSLKEGLQEAYQIPVYTLTPLQAFSYDKDFDLTSLRESGELSLLASLGFLLAGSSLKMNLIPAEILKKKRSSVRRRILVRFWGMLLIAVVLGSCAGGIHIYHDSITLSRLTKKMEEPRTRVHQAEQTIQSWRFIKDRMGHRIFMAEIMEQLYHLTPGEISFHSLYIDGEGGLTIQGIADTAGLVNDFQNRLVNSESFKDVQLEYATQRKRFHQEYIDFKITGHLKTEGRVDDEG